MTRLGIIHLVSMLYLSAIICLSVSVNENDTVGRVIRETMRRWVKFVGVTIALMVLVSLLD